VSGSTFSLGATAVSCKAEDDAGNSSTGSFTVTVKDTTAPTLTVPTDITALATSAFGATVTYGGVFSTDLVDATPTVGCSPVSGGAFPLGTTQVACSATDDAGNTATAFFRVRVIYSWSGVLQPINTDGSSVFKLGSTVPVKFQLTGSSAGITDMAARLYLAKVSEGVAGTELEAESTAAATTGNLFRSGASDGQYIFNLGTKNLTEGTYLLRIDLGDGMTYTVLISLR
jgi:hypothetical protein